MSHSDNNSSMRYLLASLKPFGRLAFWGPLGMLSLGLILYWQYQQHPEWLNQIVEQPESFDNYFRPTSIPATQPNSLQPNPQTPQPSTANPNKEEGANWATEWKKGLSQEQLVPFSINNSNKSNVKKPESVTQTKQDSSLFMPLLPTVKSNSQEPTAIKPYQVQQTPVSENYLKQAVDRLPTINYPTNSYRPNVTANPPGPYNAYNPNPTYPQSVNQPVNPAVTGYQPPYTGYNNQPVAPGYPPTQPYQNPAYPNYARPTTPTYPPTQTYQPPNSYGTGVSGNVNPQPKYQVQPTINARPAGL